MQLGSRSPAGPPFQDEGFPRRNFVFKKFFELVKMITEWCWSQSGRRGGTPRSRLSPLVLAFSKPFFVEIGRQSTSFYHNLPGARWYPETGSDRLVRPLSKRGSTRRSAGNFADA